MYNLFLYLFQNYLKTICCLKSNKNKNQTKYNKNIDNGFI